MIKKRSLSESMASISKMINGVLTNEDVQATMATYGYTAARIQAEGLTQYNAVNELILAQQREYGEQYAASSEVSKSWNACYGDYMQTLRLCRVALKNKKGALHSIGATGTRKRSLTGFIDDARLLYGNLLSQNDLLQAVSSFGITEEKLNTALVGINELEAAYHTFFKEKGEAQHSTLQRDKAFDELYDWYSDFRATARVALADTAQMLEKLGIVMK